MSTTELYLYNKTKRIYYKDVYEAWSQPIFASNNLATSDTIYRLTASHESTPAWHAFNGNSTTQDNCWWTKHGVTSIENPCWICLQSTRPLKLTKVAIHNEVSTPRNFKLGVLEASVNGVIWEKITDLEGFSAEVNTSVIKEFTMTKGFNFFRLYFTESFGTDGLSIQDITLYGTIYATTIEATAQDYDYYEDAPELKSLKLETAETLHYFKYKYIPWNKPGHPSLSSNTSDPQFKVSASSIYSSDFYVFNSFRNSSGANPWFAADSDTNPWYRIDLDRPIRITRVDMRNRSSQYGTGADKPYIFQARNYDTEEWVDLTPKTTAVSAGQGATWSFYPAALKGYRQYRWLFESKGGVSIGFPTFVWEEEVPVTCVESDKYDGYTIIPSELYTTGVTYPKKKYYKRGIEPNLRLRGTPTIIDGVYSNITANTASLLPGNSYSPGSQDWEWHFKVTIGTDTNSATIMCICNAGKGFTEATRYATRIYTYKNYFIFSVSKSGTAWDYLNETSPETNSAFPIQPNTSYWVKLIHKAGVYTLYVSLDGTHYIKYHSANLGYYMYNDNTAWIIGAWNNGSYVGNWQGDIDLKESYIKFGDTIIWRGTFPEECSEEEAEWSEWTNTDKPIN